MFAIYRNCECCCEAEVSLYSSFSLTFVVFAFFRRDLIENFAGSIDVYRVLMRIN